MSGIKKEVRRILGGVALPAVGLVEVPPVTQTGHVGCGIVPGKKQGT